MRFIIPVLIICMALPVSVFAEPPSEPPIVPRITGIQKGDPAPYTGVLLNTLAASQMFTERSFLNEECQLRIDFAVQKEIARMTLLLDSTKTSMESMEQRYATIIQIKDTEIKRLSELALEPKNDYAAWWGTGGVIVGIALTIGIVYAVGELR